MRHLLSVAAFGFSVALMESVVAANLPFPQLAWPGLTEDDVARLTEAGARLYEGRSIGTVERWRGPESGNAGEVKLLRSFDAHGMPCRQLDYIIRFANQSNNPDHYQLNWCRVADGSWKIVELVPPE